MTKCLLLGLALCASAAAYPLTPFRLNATETNVCNLDWHYCPSDPGCVNYQVSIKEVFVTAAGYTKVRSEDLKVGDKVELTVRGITTLKDADVVDGNFLIYDGAGKNIQAGTILGSVKGNQFTLTADFVVNEQTAGVDFEIGLDVFTDKQTGNSPEGFCISVASPERIAEEETKGNWHLDCTDNGDGTWSPKGSAIVPVPLPAAACAPTPPTPPPPPAKCDLEWYYCPDDKGCKDYKSSVHHVALAYADSGKPVEKSSTVAAGTELKVTVTGKTTLTDADLADGNYLIYDAAGKNIAAGVLVPSLKITGPDFSFSVTFKIDAVSVGADFVFGVDIFVDKQHGASPEAFCIAVASPPVIALHSTKSNWKIDCVDHGDGTWATKLNMPIVPMPLTCDPTNVTNATQV